MEALTAFITSPSIFSLVFVLLVLGLLYLAARKGLISYNNHGVKFGESNERILIRNQWEYCKACCEGQYAKIRPYCESDDLAHLIICKVLDIFQDAVAVNCISDNECYIKAKQKLVLMKIQKYCDNEHFFTPEFESCCNRFVENLIKDLFRMKKVMS